MWKRIAAAVALCGVIAWIIPDAAAQSATDVPRDPSAVGYLNLHKRHPDGSDGRVEFDSAYSADEALSRLEQIRGWLDSFRRLTREARGRVTAAAQRTIGNTGAEIQTIGFHNIPLVIEGTLLKQDYQLAQARYEVAQLKYERQQISAEDLARSRAAYRDATVRFQRFWDTKLPTD